MENRINLVFKDKSIVALSGNENGERVFDEQVSQKLKLNGKNIIVYPQTIEMISISFTKGLYKKIIEKFGDQDLFDYVDVETSSDWLTNKVREDVFRW